MNPPGFSYIADEQIRRAEDGLPDIDGRPYVPVTGNEPTFSDGRPVDTFGRSPEEAAYIAGFQAFQRGDYFTASPADWFGRGYLAAAHQEDIRVMRERTGTAPGEPAPSWY